MEAKVTLTGTPAELRLIAEAVSAYADEQDAIGRDVASSGFEPRERREARVKAEALRALEARL